MPEFFGFVILPSVYLKHMMRNKTSVKFSTWVKMHLFVFWNWHHSCFYLFGKDINIDKLLQKTFLITIFGII